MKTKTTIPTTLTTPTTTTTTATTPTTTTTTATPYSDSTNDNNNGTDNDTTDNDNNNYDDNNDDDEDDDDDDYFFLLCWTLSSARGAPSPFFKKKNISLKYTSCEHIVWAFVLGLLCCYAVCLSAWLPVSLLFCLHFRFMASFELFLRLASSVQI